uniref:Uncharacterized protein n=1 Tax=Arundo donax TaxID=35708 RepID=A0A0A9FMH7_ARUDO
MAVALLQGGIVASLAGKQSGRRR